MKDDSLSSKKLKAKQEYVKKREKAFAELNNAKSEDREGIRAQNKRVEYDCC